MAASQLELDHPSHSSAATTVSSTQSRPLQACGRSYMLRRRRSRQARRAPPRVQWQPWQIWQISIASKLLKSRTGGHHSGPTSKGNVCFNKQARWHLSLLIQRLSMLARQPQALASLLEKCMQLGIASTALQPTLRTVFQGKQAKWLAATGNETRQSIPLHQLTALVVAGLQRSQFAAIQRSSTTARTAVTGRLQADIRAATSSTRTLAARHSLPARLAVLRLQCRQSRGRCSAASAASESGVRARAGSRVMASWRNGASAESVQDRLMVPGVLSPEQQSELSITVW